MTLFRLYLLAGLILHKSTWIVVKHRGRANAVTTGKSHPPRVRLARLVKLTILLLIVVQVWLGDVFPILEEAVVLRIAGGILYTVGLITALLGRVQLGDRWSDIEVGEVAAGRNEIVSSGVYRYLRHPIYAGDLLLLLGLELSLNSWLVAAAAALIPPVVVRAIQEEHSLRQALPGYEDYAHRTKRFIPFVV